MENRKTTAVLMYFTSGFCLFGYIEFLSRLEPSGIGHSLYLLVAGAALVGMACLLSFLSLSWAAICALAAAVISFPLLWRQVGATFGPNWFWLLTYHPETSAAVISLIVSSCYGALQLRALLRSAANAGERKATWPLSAAIIYAVTLLGIANWPRIGALCFKLRYGS